MLFSGAERCKGSPDQFQSRELRHSGHRANVDRCPHDRDLFKRHRAGLKNASQTLAAVGLAEGPTLAFSVNKSGLGHGVDHMEVRRTLYTEIRSSALDVSRKQRIPRRTGPERRVKGWRLSRS